jgi:ParB family chromosome partitioning protein
MFIAMEVFSKIRSFKKEREKYTEKKIYFIPPSELVPNQNQTRQSFGKTSLSKLSDSIQKYGILQPIIIRKRENVPYIESGGERIYAETYEIVAGERRWQAALMLNMKEVPCILTDVNDKTSLEIHLNENIQRAPLHFLEEADGACRLIRGFETQAIDAAEIISLSKPALANRFKILNLSEQEKREIIKNELSERHALAISKINDEEKRFALIEQVSSTCMSAPETERAVESLLYPKYRTKGDERRKITVISDIGFFLNAINRAVSILESTGTKVDKSELDSENFYEIKIKIRKKPKTK